MKSIFKKLVSAALAVVAVSSAAITVSAKDISKYDLNGDGIFDVRDATYMQEALANGEALDSKADFDKSGYVNVNDVTYAQNIINGSFYIEPEFKLQSNSKSKLNLTSVYGGQEKKYPNSAYHPKIVDMGSKWHGYRYWISYTPYPKAIDKYENPTIVGSNDLINYSEIKFCEGIPNDYKANVRYNSDSELVYNSDKNRLELFWRYTDFEKDYMALYMRYSYDGSKWSGRNAVFETYNKNSEDMISPTIVYENGTYKVWYVKGYKVWYKELKNGEWSQPAVTNLPYSVTTYTWHIDVEKINGRYELMACATTNKSDRRHMSLYYTTSTDGKNWNTAQVVLKPSSNPTDWDGGGLYRSAFIYTNGNYIVFYSGRNDAEDFGTGLAFGESMTNLKGTDLDFINDSTDSSEKLWKYINQ